MADMTSNNFEIKEKWYFNNITIAILLIICSCIPFAAILVIPVILFKTKYLKRILSDKLILADNHAKALIERTKTEISDLTEELSNKEALKEVIIREAEKEADEKIKGKKEELSQLLKNIDNKNAIVEKIIKDAKEEATLQVSSLQEEVNNLDEKINSLSQEIKKKKSEIVELDEESLMQSFSLYKPTYTFTKSEEYKLKLNEIRKEQKAMIKRGVAAMGNLTWTVNGSKSEGKKMVKDTQKLLLRAFNSECEHVTEKVRYNNFESCEKRITKAYLAISKLGTVMNISINPDYYDSKIEELHLALEYQQKKQEEKEHQKELREQAREEAKLKKEIAEARKKVSKEKAHYSNALETALEQLSSATDIEEKNALEMKIKDLKAQLIEIDKNMTDIDYRESNQRAGYVYVISNIGSFGENVYKIGMTRRLDPMERVYELGDASVPFNFDVHAMIFSDDAPKLEAALHHAFEDKKINMVNTRREFFNVSLSDIEKVVKENYDGTVEFTKIPDAQQYRESLKMRNLPS